MASHHIEARARAISKLRLFVVTICSAVSACGPGDALQVNPAGCPSAALHAQLFEEFTHMLLEEKRARAAYESYASPEMVQKNPPFGTTRASTINQWEAMTGLPETKFIVLSRSWSGDTATVRFRGKLRPGQPGALVTQIDRFHCGKIVEENATFQVEP